MFVAALRSPLMRQSAAREIIIDAASANTQCFRSLMEKEHTVVVVALASACQLFDLVRTSVHMLSISQALFCSFNSTATAECLRAAERRCSP
jgi:hypothetical protein